TYYAAGLGACGHTNTDNDFIVALNAAQYSGGSHCGQTITISYKGKTAQAKIMDLCPGCPYGGLDLSPGLFAFFDSPDKGIIFGEWNFV
ncbi:plant-expansin-like protein, partial [Pleurotus ostreatus PC15]